MRIRRKCFYRLACEHRVTRGGCECFDPWFLLLTSPR